MVCMSFLVLVHMYTNACMFVNMRMYTCSVYGVCEPCMWWEGTEEALESLHSLGGGEAGGKTSVYRSPRTGV